MLPFRWNFRKLDLVMPTTPDFFEGVGSLRDVRHIDKTMYLGSHPLFYEFNYNSYRPSDELRQVVEKEAVRSGGNWRIRREGVWTHVVPAAHPEEIVALPAQGWKIHVSATNLNCTEILSRVAALLLPLRTQFKFASDVQTLRLLTAKRWPRGGSGKFITIYPLTTEAFGSLIEEVHEVLRGFRGSYILSDRRYKDSSCVYFRYGGIQSNKILDPFGRQVEVLRSPDGDLVVDRRNPYYERLPWVDEVLPEVAIDADAEDMTLNGGRFVVVSALAFSNTGGVYLAEDTTTGQQVVVKEARPGVELAPDGTDATDRLAHEAELLRGLNDSGITPKLVTTFRDWENFYLVEEHLDARNMRQIMLDHSPLLKVHADRKDSEAFYGIFRSIFVSLLTAISELHRRDVVIGDLSPMNILVADETLTVKIIDLEGAFLSSSEVRQEIHTPGFRANVKGREKESNFRDDLYAVGVIMMYSMFPVSAMAYLREDIFETVLPVLLSDIGWQSTPVGDIIRGLVAGSISCADAAAVLRASEVRSDPAPIVARPRPTPPILDTVRDIGSFITAHWRSDSDLTLFPIDPFGQVTNPSGLYLGTSGVMWALSRTGADIPCGAMDRYRSEIAATDPRTLTAGLMTGSAGIAMALLGMGESDLARPFVDHTRTIDLGERHHSLYYGLAGMGLALLAAYRHYADPACLARSIEIAERLRSAAKEDGRGIFWKDAGAVRIGMGYGQSGVALFFLRLSQLLGDGRWKSFGRKCIQYDMSHGVQLEPGVTSFPGEQEAASTVFPYIEQGSGGIAKIAMRYGLWDGLDEVIATAHRTYSGFPGLVFGLAGFVDVLGDAYRYSGDRRYFEMALRPLRGLHDLYMFRTKEGMAAPGENLFRVSCDYATGLAGIMYTLHRMEHALPDDLTLDWLDQGEGVQPLVACA